MKIKSRLTSFLFIVGLALGMSAQQGPNQAFWVHEDQVKPSMMNEYEKTSKELVEACKSNNISDINWTVASMNDGTYLSITPIKGMSDIENMNFNDLREKMGDESFSKIFEDFDKCYDKHGDYVTILIPNLSYMPDGLSTSTPGQNYRVWHRMDVSPANVQKFQAKMKELKDMFASKNSKLPYRVYRSGFGNMGDSFVAVLSAKDAMDYDSRSTENQKLLGEEGDKLFDELFDYVDAYSVKRGGMRPDLSYQPAGEANNNAKD
ncbi:hypothetical protein [Christiangramia sabulilitoris]|uniref:Uncharacterized protein n=1 Tax=Christiangramia sabulilitoris TaxID=2583991 RepID=A0A550I6Z2_9FLAO|nr:hypothetical protein [Christiangramia sabulilitoris]TRO66746.1 hypothetical protein FGM01_02325 [Christiangramia sabulilitoris]